MSLRGLALLALLLVIAVVFVWRVDRPEPAPATSPETVGALLPADLAAVKAIELARDGQTVRVERSGEHGWKLASPIQDEADPRQVESLFRAARDAKVRRVVEAQATDRTPFGLAPAAATLRVERMDGTGAATLEIGRESPMGGSRYAIPADGRVLLVEGLDAGVLDRKADSLRERRLIPLADTEIAKISLSRPGGALAVERDDGGWRLTDPLKDTADAPTTDGLARTVAGLSFSETALAPVALAGAPEITVVVAAQDGRTLQAELGPEMPDGTRWARRQGSLKAGVLEAGSLSDLTRQAAEYRDRRVLTVEADEILAIRIVDGASSLRVARKEGDSTWSVREEPGGSPVAASAAKVDELIDRLRWLRAERFDDPAPGADARVVELEGKQGSLGRIEVDREPHDKLLRLRSSWRPGASLSVPAERVGSLPQRAADLTDTPPTPPTSP